MLQLKFMLIVFNYVQTNDCTSRIDWICNFQGEKETNKTAGVENQCFFVSNSWPSNVPSNFSLAFSANYPSKHSSSNRFSRWHFEGFPFHFPSLVLPTFVFIKINLIWIFCKQYVLPARCFKDFEVVWKLKGVFFFAVQKMLSEVSSKRVFLYKFNLSGWTATHLNKFMTIMLLQVEWKPRKKFKILLRLGK